MPAHGREADAAPEAIARARGLVEFLNANAERIEAGRALPADVVAALHAARMFRLLLPRSLGGDELHLKTLAQVTEVIGGADASTAWCLGQAAGCAMAAASLKPEVARRLFGPADAVLAWGAGIQGKAHAVDGGYRVTGKWTFASGCANATLLGGHSYIFEKDGSPRKRADGRQADRSLLFVASKAAIHDMWHTLGLRGTASYTYEVADLFVPEEETIDREDPKERLEPGTLYLFPATLAYAAAFSGLMLGLAQTLVSELKALAMTKTPRGAPSTLKESPVFQTQLALLEARLRASRAYLHAALDRDLGQGRRNARAHPRGRRRPQARHHLRHQPGRGGRHRGLSRRGPDRHLPHQPLRAAPARRPHRLAADPGRPSNFTTIGRVMLGLPPDTIFLR